MRDDISLPVKEIARRQYARYRRYSSLELSDLMQAGHLAALENPSPESVARVVRRFARSEDLRARREIVRSWVLNSRGGPAPKGLLNRIELRRAMARIDRSHSDLLRRFWYKGETEKEIAGTLGLPESAVRLRLAVALAQLRLAMIGPAKLSKTSKASEIINRD